MITVQMRTYEFAPGDIDGFVSWWRGAVLVYEHFGFDVLFGVVDRDHNELVWAVCYPDDVQGFRDAKAALSSSSEWAAVMGMPRPRPQASHESFVDLVAGPHAPAVDPD